MEGLCTRSLGRSWGWVLIFVFSVLPSCVIEVAARGGDGADAGMDSESGSESGVDAGTGGEPSPEDPSAFVFDESVIREYSLVVAPSDWDWLEQNALLEEFVPATLHYQDESYANAAVRYKGAFGSLKSCFDEQGNRLCKKLSLKVSFNEYDSEGRFHGLKKLLFHSMERDPAKMREAIAYRLFADMGLPTSRTAYARVTVNGEYLGLFAVVEYVDGRFTRAHFPDGGEGNLYKRAWPGVAGASTNYFLDKLRTNEDENPSVDRMLRFSQEIAAAAAGEVGTVAAAWQVEDQLMRYMAVARLIDHWDDVVTFYCGGATADTCGNHNYYWYESQTDDQVWLIPWDTDQTLTSYSPPRDSGVPGWDEPSGCELIPREGASFQYLPPSCDPLLGGLAASSRQLYLDYVDQLVAGPLSDAQFALRVEELRELIDEEIAQDPNGPTLEEWHNQVDQLAPILTQKRSFVSVD